MVQSSRLASIHRAWIDRGSPSCGHDSFEKEYFLGSQGEDYGCLGCGITWLASDQKPGPTGHQDQRLAGRVDAAVPQPAVSSRGRVVEAGVSDVSGHEPAVRLPTDRSIRKNEALHELAWRDLLDLVPGALATLLSRAPLPAHVDARTLATGTQVRFVGGCGSDLFVTCATCRCDRAVVEIKGPTASMNVGDEGWQTDVYRDKYLSGRSGTCQCVIARPTPLLFLLDARNRDHQTIEEVEGRRYPLDLSEWIVLPYKIILQLQPFAGHPLALWLEGR